MLAPPAGIPRHWSGTPLKRIKEVLWTYVAGAVIVDTVYLWSRAAHPLSRGVRRQAGGMYMRDKNYELITLK